MGGVADWAVLLLWLQVPVLVALNAIGAEDPIEQRQEGPFDDRLRIRREGTGRARRYRLVEVHVAASSKYPFQVHLEDGLNWER